MPDAEKRQVFAGFIIFEKIFLMKSMTGYGSAFLDNDSYQISVEIKTLNSKFFDAVVKSPKQFSEKEIEIRNVLSEYLDRGKIALTVEFQRKDASKPKININKQLFSFYYQEFSELADNFKASKEELFKLAIQAPDVLTPDIDNEDLDREFEILKETIIQAAKDCDQFRINEGKALKLKILEYTGNIEKLMERITPFEGERIESVKTKLRNAITELLNDADFDKNRFEQEMIYYIEKLDINEEKDRLASHIEYFRNTLEETGQIGKKLGFITQEMGREINTMGSKANHAGIQRIVIQMKEELEKIKEQMLNII